MYLSFLITYKFPLKEIEFENKILDDSDLFDPADNFPLVFGKDANEVRAYILD